MVSIPVRSRLALTKMRAMLSDLCRADDPQCDQRAKPAVVAGRLRAIGLRPISALVDITNFFTFDQNRPLHVFDADKVQGDLRIHRAKGGETSSGWMRKNIRSATGRS